MGPESVRSGAQTSGTTPTAPHQGSSPRLWRSPASLWRKVSCPVEEPATFGGTRRMSPQSLARPSAQGIELLPRPPATDGGTARRRGSVRRGDPPRQPGDEDAGTGVEGQSIGSVTSTDRPKGPWNSYFRGP